MSGVASSDRTQIDTVVVGGGPAGLAVGACLKRAGVPFVILEQAEQVGPAWRSHYDRLHLHTDKQRSELPHLSYPDHYPRYPSRQQVVAYLEAYARHFALAPQFGRRVTSARFRNGHWETRTQDACYISRHLVVATGYTREPHVPAWPGQEAFRGRVLHSADYDNGARFRGQQVLVVGFGNSGGEIASDLREHGAYPGLSVRSPVNVIPRDLFGWPILAWAILLSKLPARVADTVTAPILHAKFGDVYRRGLRKLPYGPFTQTRRDDRIPLIDVGTVDLIRRGAIEVYPAIERFGEAGVVFTDGRRQAFDAIVLATGYRPRVDAFLEEAADAVDAQGCPRHSGRESALPGLYFCGFHVSPTGVLREIAREAVAISRAIGERAPAEPRSVKVISEHFH